MPTTIQDMMLRDAKRAAEYFHAFKECSPQIQEIVCQMAEIIVDPNSDDEERDHALNTMIEALFPGVTADLLEYHRGIMRSPEAVSMRQELDAEETAFADRLRSFMHEKKLTQEQLAAATGIGQPAISNMLNRRCRPQERTVEKFAVALGVTAAELWPDRDEKA